MFDPPGDEDVTDSPPVNGAMECYRMLLWLVPTGVAMMTLVGWATLASWFRVLPKPMVLPWLGLNLAATIGRGNFRARLKASCDEGTASGFDGVDVVIFVLVQMILVPFLTYVGFMVLVVSGVL